MAQYSPKKVIRSISKALLQRYFAGRRLLGDFKWGEYKEGDPDAIVKAMEDLETGDRVAVDADFATVSELATDGGSRLIYEEASYLKKPWVNKLADMANDIERALLALIEDRQLIETVLACNEMDRFGESRWQRWNVGKRLHVNDDDQHKDRLENALREIFRHEGRGKHCHLDPVERRDPERYCLFAYPEDYPKTDLGYDSKGKFARQIRRTATEIIFVYRREDGVLEMIAGGDQKRREKIAEAFCKEILGLKILPDPRANPPFSLDVLKRGDFAFKTAPADNVERVELRLLRFDLPGKGYRRLVLSGRPTPDMPNVLRGMIEEAINTTKVPLSELHVSQARLSFRFRGQNGKRGKTLTFEVTYPDRCNLKDHGLDVVAKKYLVEWKIASA
ncbi:MAG: hypothetical protein HRU76_13230 [Phycisphaeraceae bacterium]|nr:hypothetical protein [Phycisphaerales bacterium]QOJ18492.1 MAG: hypothetical protein HRU76_13230 [Phycisphaeraceae bacterium]